MIKSETTVRCCLRFATHNAGGMVEAEEEHEVWRGLAHIATACRLALQAQDTHAADAGCVHAHLSLARAIDTALANLYLSLHDAVALGALLNDADNLVEVAMPLCFLSRCGAKAVE